MCVALLAFWIRGLFSYYPGSRKFNFVGFPVRGHDHRYELMNEIQT